MLKTTKLVYLIGLVEEQTKVGKHNPEFLPTIAILEFPQEIATQLIDHRSMIVLIANARVAMPAHMHGRVGSMLLMLTSLLLVVRLTCGRCGRMLTRALAFALLIFFLDLIQIIVGRTFLFLFKFFHFISIKLKISFFFCCYINSSLTV